MKTIKYTIVLPIILCVSIISFAQDEDSDGINDNLEQALAKKFAPEWRFNKRVEGHPREGVRVSAQNKDESNFPSSVQYLVEAKKAKDGVYPDIQFDLGIALSKIVIIPFSDINTIGNIINPKLNISASDPSWGCSNNRITMEFPDNLPGEPNSFPTYYHCNKSFNGNIVIDYFMFAPFNNAHSPLGIGDHRGDWEWFSVVVENVNLSTQNIEGSKIQYIIFDQHGSDKQYLHGNSQRLRYVKLTHPKVYVALGSHGIYPEPGALIDRRVTGWGPIGAPDIYDDIYLGNGLIVQSWERNNGLVNLGEYEKPMDNTKWTTYKGRWGGNDDQGPMGPACRFTNGNISGILSWDEWITNTSGGHKKNWNGIYFDCYEHYSSDLSPNPNNDCNIIVNWRHTCDQNLSLVPEVWSSFHDLMADFPNIPSRNVCAFPGNYPGAITLNKPMVIKAIEGNVIIGK